MPHLLCCVIMFAKVGHNVKHSILISLAATAGALLLPAQAQAATANATISASITRPVQLTGGGTLAFGAILTPSTATYSGTFTVAATATQTGTYCASGFTCSGTPQAAAFNIQGTNKTNIGINIPLTVTLTLQNYTGGGATPTITATTTNSLVANNGTGSYTVQLPNSGAPGLNFYVGGAMTVSQATTDGTYAGTFTITADYN